MSGIDPDTNRETIRAIGRALQQGKTWEEISAECGISVPDAVASYASRNIPDRARLELIRSVVELVVSGDKSYVQIAEETGLNKNKIAGLISRHVNEPLTEAARSRSTITKGSPIGRSNTEGSVRRPPTLAERQAALRAALHAPWSILTREPPSEEGPGR